MAITCWALVPIFMLVIHVLVPIFMLVIHGQHVVTSKPGTGNPRPVALSALYMPSASAHRILKEKKFHHISPTSPTTAVAQLKNGLLPCAASHAVSHGVPWPGPSAAAFRCPDRQPRRSVAKPRSCERIRCGLMLLSKPAVNGLMLLTTFP